MYLANMSSEECPVCLDVLSGKVCTLSCNHKLHEECLISHVRKSPYKTCPMCRAEYKPDPEIKYKVAKAVCVEFIDKLKVTPDDPHLRRKFEASWESLEMVRKTFSTIQDESPLVKPDLPPMAPIEAPIEQANARRPAWRIVAQPMGTDGMRILTVPALDDDNNNDEYMTAMANHLFVLDEAGRLTRRARPMNQ